MSSAGAQLPAVAAPCCRGGCLNQRAGEIFHYDGFHTAIDLL